MRFKPSAIAGLILLMYGIGYSAETVRVILTADADSSICSAARNKNFGNAKTLGLRGYPSNAEKFYVRFKLPKDFGKATSATFKIVLARTAKYNHTCNCYGLKADAAGERWKEMTITWDNAPANNKKYSGDPGAFIPVSDITLIGSFGITGQAYKGQPAGSEFTISGDSLVNFLNTHSNKQITLMCASPARYSKGVNFAANRDIDLMFTTTSASTSGVGFASKENSRYAPPRLELEYIPIDRLSARDKLAKDKKILGTPIHSEPWNLITNGEFNGGNLLPTKWSVWPKKLPSNILMLRDTTMDVSIAGYNTGVRACALIDKMSASNIAACWYQDNIKVKAGSCLGLIAYAQTIGNITPPLIRIDFYDAMHKKTKTQAYIFPSGDGQWKILHKKVKVPAKCERLRISLIAGEGKGRTRFDAVMLCKFDENLAKLAQQRWHYWLKARKRFPTAGWTFFGTINYGPKETEYQRYADVGLSMVKLPVNKDDYRRAKAAGLELLLYRSSDVNFPTPTDSTVIGYFLRDEPTNRQQIVALGKAAAKIYREDKRGAIPMVNQWGGNVLDEVIMLQYPCYLQVTCYDLLDDGRTLSRHYPALEGIRKTALENNIGFMGWVLVSNHSSGNIHFRQASESDIYWQVYSLVTYGGKGVWYYRYFNSDFSGDKKGNYHTRDYIKAVNAELDALWPVIKHLRSTGVFHCHKEANPEKIDGAYKRNGKWAITLYKDGDIPVIRRFEGDKFLLGMFKNTDNSADKSIYLMVQNKRHAMNTAKDDSKMVASARFRTAPDIKHVQRFDVKKRQWIPLTKEKGTYKLTLSGGQGILLRFF